MRIDKGWFHPQLPEDTPAFEACGSCRGLHRFHENSSGCHPEESRSNRDDEGSLQLLDFTTTEILRFALGHQVEGFARNGSLEAFFPACKADAV